MSLGKKRSASAFQNKAARIEKNGSQPLSTEPELITKAVNTSEPTTERFANLQFGPDVDVLNPPDAQEAAPLRDNRALRAHGLFFTPETEGKDFSSVLAEVQAYISEHYSTLLTAGGEDAKAQMKRYIQKFLQDNRISVNGMSGGRLADALYTEMAEFGFLTKYIFGTGIEEIDINSWRDIEVQYSDGRTVKLEERFESPQHAVNVIRRMLHISGMVLDNASPIVLGHLSKNIRIAVLKSPIVDEDVGVAASIRIVNPQSMKKRILSEAVRRQTQCWTFYPFASATGFRSA